VPLGYHGDPFIRYAATAKKGGIGHDFSLDAAGKEVVVVLEEPDEVNSRAEQALPELDFWEDNAVEVDSKNLWI